MAKEPKIPNQKPTEARISAAPCRPVTFEEIHESYLKFFEEFDPRSKPLGQDEGLAASWQHAKSSRGWR